MITQSKLHELFDESHGNLFWKEACKGYEAGRLAGYIHAKGRRIIGIARTYHYAHRLVYLYHHGWMPKVVEHIDGDRTNNRIENLVASDNSAAKARRPKKPNTASQYKGVYWHTKAVKWCARIGANCRTKSLGLYENEADAAQAYNFAAYELHGHNATLNEVPQPWLEAV